MVSINHHKKQFDREYEAVHIVSGESSAGTLRVGLGHKNLVIGFPEFFAVGPIWMLDKEEGREQRYGWLKDHINIPEDYMEEEYKYRVVKALEQIRAIPEHLPVVIWTAENADEQTGLRYFLHLLKQVPNDIFLINTTLAYQELFNTDEVTYIYSHTGEVHPDKIKLIYSEKKNSPLTIEERERFHNEWKTLAETKEVLRVWEDNEVKSVNEDYYDHLIMTTAQRLHKKQGDKGFIKSARIIGDVLGQMDGRISDSFLEYRIRTLVYSGVFEIKGIPKGMRYYSVKLQR